MLPIKITKVSTQINLLTCLLRQVPIISISAHRWTHFLDRILSDIYNPFLIARIIQLLIMPSKIHHLVQKMTNIKQSRDFKPDFVKGEGFFRLEWIFPFSTIKTTFTCILTATTTWSSMSDMMFSPLYYFDKETMAYCLQLQVEAKRG